MLFSNRDLKKLIIPLIIEQVLALTIGIFDTMMVSQCGQSAVSGVSIVDGLNVLIINIFSALATGGAVVCSQYIGKKDEKMACHSAKQLLFTILGLSLVIMVLCMLFNGNLLNLIFGHIESDVMAYARTYFFFSALSYPFIGLFNGGAALFRSMGNSKVAMTNSFYMNIGNIVLNYFFIFILNMSVKGAAIATLLSRMFCSFIILYMLLNKEHIVHIDTYLKYKFDFSTVKRILKIGIPNGLENSIFQFGKLLVGGLIASYGEVGMTANAIGNSITSLPCIPGKAIGLAMISVVGQCVGAGKLDEAKRYTWKLLKYASISTLVLNVIVSLCVSPIVNLFEAQAATKELAIKFVIYDSICCSIFWPSAFTLPNALRAANDVKYTMLTSIVSMWIFRVGFSFVLAQYFGLGVFGVWVAMSIDWCFRAILFIGRMASGGWKKYAYIGSVVTK